MFAVGFMVWLVAAQVSTEVPASLLEARALADQLRYEESVVEYQRYLAIGARPAKERAQALFELSFIHFVLADEATAQARAFEALELDAALLAPEKAPPKQAEFWSRMRAESLSRPRVTLEPQRPTDRPGLLRVTLGDPRRRVSRLLLRYAFAPRGPFDGAAMQCTDAECEGTLPTPDASRTFTAWYFVEALASSGATVGHLGTPDQPLSLAVSVPRPWYQSPLIWGVVGVVLVGSAAMVYALSPQPPR